MVTNLEGILMVIILILVFIIINQWLQLNTIGKKYREERDKLWSMVIDQNKSSCKYSTSCGDRVKIMPPSSRWIP